MQLADELPMIYTTCIMGFATFAYGKGTVFRLWLGSALLGLAASITVSHRTPLLCHSNDSKLNKCPDILSYHQKPSLPPGYLRRLDDSPHLQGLLRHEVGDGAGASPEESRKGRQDHGTDELSCDDGRLTVPDWLCFLELGQHILSPSHIVEVADSAPMVHRIGGPRLVAFVLRSRFVYAKQSRSWHSTVY